MSSKKFDLVIAGAGIMGMGCALEAAAGGKSVGVFDPFGEGNKASWAAAGILVTRDARKFLSPFREFYVRSIRMYPQWLEEIADRTGQRVPLHQGGDFQVYDLDTPKGNDNWEAKRRQLERENSQRYTVAEKLPDFLAAVSPLEKVRVLHFPEDAYIQNRDLLEALKAACLHAGVHFLAADTLSPMRFSDGRSHLDFASETWEAGAVVVAAGSWSVKILESLGFKMPMIPVKGQLKRIAKFYPDDCMVHFNEDIYFVPRGDSLVVGATTEPGNWNEGFDESGEAYLGKHLQSFLPGLADAALEEWWGFRPRTRDRLPMMGWLDPEKRWAICTGHYKCGISMAPMAAKCIARMLRGEKPLLDLEPFNPWRKQGLSLLSTVG